MRRALVAALGLSIAGCFGDPKVVRVYGGHIVEGPYVPPDAYAAYLQGVLAEEAGDLRGALGAYENAARYDDEDPEPLARIADVRCRLNPKDGGADDALAKALRLDRGYAGALAVKARCELARGKAAEALETVGGVAAADRTSTTLETLYVHAAAARPGASEGRWREQAIALTAAHAHEPAAWDALLAWGRAKGDVELVARGLEGLGRAAPMRVAEVERGALDLAAMGEVALARRVAASVADAPIAYGDRAIRDGGVARLAIDDALVRGDEKAAQRRALRGHVGLGEVAARAVLLEQRGVAAAIAGEVLRAEPADGCSVVVGAVLGPDGAGTEGIGRRERTPPSSARSSLGSTTLPPACSLVMAERLALSGTDLARGWLGDIGISLVQDPLVAPLAVDLAARGVVAEAALTPGLRLELAARRREAPPSSIAVAELDPRHALLWHSLVGPGGTEARALLAKMQRAADRDPIIGFALARAAIAGGTTAEGWDAVRRALAAAPSHPLLLAASVEVAKRGGKAEEVTPARTRLMAVARTPAERALAAE